jgi:hypothetical protein
MGGPSSLTSSPLASNRGPARPPPPLNVPYLRSSSSPSSPFPPPSLSSSQQPHLNGASVAVNPSIPSYGSGGSSVGQQIGQTTPVRPTPIIPIVVAAPPTAIVASSTTTTATMMAPSNGSVPQGVCRAWTAHGNCRFGATCRFSHASPAAAPSTMPSQQVPPTLVQPQQQLQQQQQPLSASLAPTNGRLSMTITGPHASLSSPLVASSSSQSQLHAHQSLSVPRSPSFLSGITSDAPSMSPPRSNGAASPTLSPSTAPPGVCRDWSERGTCRNFSTCRYQHPAREPRPGAPVCFKWAADGKCEFGMACRFSHGVCNHLPSFGCL